MAQLKIKLVKSLIGVKNQNCDCPGFRLERIGDCTTQPDNPQTKGKGG
ncbi:MAG: 50S ribosomal protein L30 [Acutalibacteraceae bacterium]